MGIFAGGIPTLPPGGIIYPHLLKADVTISRPQKPKNSRLAKLRKLAQM